jgi:hypothetical protein
MMLTADNFTELNEQIHEFYKSSRVLALDSLAKQVLGSARISALTLPSKKNRH